VYCTIPHREEVYYQSAFDTFIKDHQKSYKDENEKHQRYNIFKKNIDYINFHNNYKQSTYTLGVNQFADLTNQEYKEKFLKFRASKDQNFRSLISSSNLHHPGDIPKTLDWRTKGAVSYVKDQGQCGSCWAFSTSGTVEGALAIKNSKMQTLTEQQIIDCSWVSPYNNLGCDGGDMRSALQYLIDTKGIETESKYPYVDYNGGNKHKCKFDQSLVVGTISAMVNVTSGNETDLLYSTLHGPVSIAIDASQSSFQFYSGGIYYEPFCHSDLDSLDHGVLVVGYGDGYYLVKNSWGPGWGWQGYIYMSRNQHNNCGIATYATYPML
jgi:cathepsin L